MRRSHNPHKHASVCLLFPGSVHATSWLYCMHAHSVWPSTCAIHYISIVAYMQASGESRVFLTTCAQQSLELSRCLSCLVLPFLRHMRCNRWLPSASLVDESEHRLCISVAGPSYNPVNHIHARALSAWFVLVPPRVDVGQLAERVFDTCNKD